MNIALVVLDTLRKDAFEKHFDWLPGRYYSNAWSTSHWTVPVHGSLFTGKYPSEIGVYAGAQSLDCEQKVLAERLTTKGYTTRAYSCNVNISSLYGFDRGFQEFELLGNHDLMHWHDPDLYDWSEFMREFPAEHGRKRYLKALKECIFSDHSTIPSLLNGIKFKFDLNKKIFKNKDMGSNSVLKKINETDFGNQEFLFLNLMEAHAPYRIPKKYRDKDDYEKPENPLNSTENTNMEPVKRRYDNAVEYLSDKYREIFNELKEEFEYIITISDHGELLGEHGFYEHAHGLYPELVNVPLSIYGPQTNTEENLKMVSLINIHQTILDLARVNSVSEEQNILSEPLPNEFISECHGFPYPNRHKKKMEDFGIQNKEIKKYVENLNAIALSDDYYGYQTVDGFVDVGNCPIDDPQEKLDELVGELTRRTVNWEGQEVPESVETSLEDLGYI